MAGQQSFVASIDAWVAETKERLDAVAKESAQRIVSIMQTPVGAGGAMPVDTGFLRASIRASTSQMPSINPSAKGGESQRYAYSPGDVTLVIAGAQSGQTIFIGYTAAYAAHVEYGTSKHQARRFVGLAAAQWQATVSAVAAELKAGAKTDQ